MFFFNPKPKKHEEVHVQEIRFLGEQDGQPERLLKTKLADFFERDKSVNKAYLTRVCLDGKNISVVLGLRTQFGADKGLVEKIGNFFATVFNGKEHLDIMFLTDNQEIAIEKTCHPFFEKS